MSLMAPQISFFVFALTLPLGIASATDVLIASSAVEYGYSGNTRPDQWGNLNPKCSSGKMQSPINIMENVTVHDKLLQPLISNYKPANSTLETKGFNVGLRLQEYGGEVVIDCKNYELKQMHWHVPSEHRINGEEFAAELHLVHRAADSSMAVVAVLYKENFPDPFMAKIMNGLNELAKVKRKPGEVAQIPMGTFDIKQLKQSSGKYYRYVGSLTTPPCSENVTWSILGEVRSISVEQIAALQAPVNSNCKKNARPCQPLNGRMVEIYDA